MYDMAQANGASTYHHVQPMVFVVQVNSPTVPPLFQEFVELFVHFVPNIMADSGGLFPAEVVTLIQLVICVGGALKLHILTADNVFEDLLVRLPQCIDADA